MRTATDRVIRGPAWPGRRTKDLIPKLPRGDIAVIDQNDMDALSASGLVERRVADVVNAAPALSGAIASGPSILLDAGVRVFEGAGSELLDPCAPANARTARRRQLVQGKGDAARAHRGVAGTASRRRCTSDEMRAFVQNTLSYLSEEWTLLFEALPLPPLRTRIADRHVLIVVRGEGYRDDLQAILPYVRGERPVLIGVDGGADTLLQFGLRPDIILGDMDSVSDDALRCGAELIVHGYPRGTADRARRAGDDPSGAIGAEGTCCTRAAPARTWRWCCRAARGATIVAGAHFAAGVSRQGRKDEQHLPHSPQVGSILVDARRQPLYRRGLRVADMFWIVLAFLVLVFVILSVSESARTFVDLLGVNLRVNGWVVCGDAGTDVPAGEQYSFD